MASLWLEAFDEASQCTYYYHSETGETSWTLPIEDETEEVDLSFFAFAAVRLQAQFRGQRDRARVTRLVRHRYDVTVDPVTHATLFTDRRTGTSSWTPPALVTRLGIDFTATEEEEDDEEDFDVDAFQPPEAQEQEEEEEEEEETDAKKKKRTFPRSIAQQRVDAAEDLGADATALDMSHLYAWKLSSRIWNLASLTRLSLAHNQLTRVPSGIQDLVHLAHLDLSHNSLSRLPSCLQTTTTLTHLDASHNRITAFSPKLWKLRSLVELHLNSNSLTTLPFVEGDLKLLRDTREWRVGIGLLTALEVLDLSRNKLTTVPESIETCGALRVLNLSHNRLEELREEIGDLAALEDVDVSHNALAHLPESLGSLSRVTTLRLASNRLTIVPDSLGNLESLEDLDLRSNDLQRLPVAFGALGRLTKVALDGNARLATVATCWRFLPSLNHVSVAACGLVALETTDVWGKAPVAHLCCRDNAFAEFPLNFERSAMRLTLTHLDLAHNALTAFPTEITACRALVALDLSHNRLRQLPTDLSVLRSLETVVLSHNELGPTLPDAVAWLPRLRSLQCHHNRLTSLPLAIGILKNLQHLDVGFNDLMTLPTSCLDLVDSLQSLHVNDNRLTTRPPVVALLSPSCFVDLSNNPFEHTSESEELYAAAVQCFDHAEFAEAETLLTQALAQLEPQSNGRRRHDHLPTQLFLRGLCRYNMVKQARVVIRDASETIDACETQLDGDRLVRQRHAAKVSLKANDRPETDDTSNQHDDDPTRVQLHNAQTQRTAARITLQIATTGAIDDLNRALELGVAEIVTAHVVLGYLYMETLDFASAIQSFTRALERVVLIPESVPTTSIALFVARADAARLLGQLPAACADVDRIVESKGVNAPEHVVTKAEALARAWRIQQSQYFVDHDSLARAFDMDATSGLARRPEVDDLHAIFTPAQRQERLSKTPTQRFADRVASLSTALATAAAAKREAMELAYDLKGQALARARDFKREVRENLVMEMEEHTQRVVEAELARLAELKRQELDREFNERMFMKYEDEYMQWLVSEEARLEAERQRREDDARRRAEAKAQYEMRLARRGGRRQRGGRTPSKK